MAAPMKISPLAVVSDPPRFGVPQPTGSGTGAIAPSALPSGHAYRCLLAPEASASNALAAAG